MHSKVVLIMDLIQTHTPQHPHQDLRTVLILSIVDKTGIETILDRADRTDLTDSANKDLLGARTEDHNNNNSNHKTENLTTP